jgi:hypothetical protein
VLGALVALLAFPGAAAASDELWALLGAGGSPTPAVVIACRSRTT